MESLAGLCKYTKNYKDLVVNNLNTKIHVHLTHLNHACCVERLATTSMVIVQYSTTFFLKKHYISWKLFLTKDHQQKEETSHDNKINQLKWEYLEVKAEQHMSQEETISFNSDDHEYVQYNLDF